MRLSARSVATFGAIGLALGNVGRIPTGALNGRPSPLVVADLAVGLLWMVLILALMSGRVRPAIDDVISVVVAFVAVAAVSLVLAISRYHLGVDGVGPAAFLVRWIAYFGWYPFVLWVLTPDEARGAWQNIERVILAFAIVGIIQSAFFPGFAQIVQDGGDLPTWDVQGRRLVSSILDPNFAGIIIVIGLLSRLARVAEDVRENVLSLIVLTTALLLTLSRGAMLALAVGLFVIVAARGFRLRLMRYLVVGVVLLLPFMTLLLSFAGSFNKLEYDGSAAQRLIPWTRQIKLIAEHPWFGVGFNAIKQAQEAHGWRAMGGADVGFDGGLLTVTAMTGLVGLVVYVFMLIRVCRGARRVWRDTNLASVERAHGTATAAVAMAVVVHSLFANSLLLPFVMQILWVMWARLGHIRASRRARLNLAVGIPLAIAAVGCDPCGGTFECSRTPQATLVGTIVDHSNGKVVGGTRVEARFHLPGGSDAMASTMTDGDGLWKLGTSVVGGGDVGAEVTVTAPNRPSYTVPSFSVRSSSIRGEATNAGQWTDVPFTRYFVTVRYASVPLSGAAVQFVPTSGPTLTFAQTTAVTSGGGIFELDFEATQVSPVFGVLTISHPSLVQPTVIADYAIPLDYHFGIPRPHGEYIDVGPIPSDSGRYVPGAAAQRSAPPGYRMLTAGVNTRRRAGTETSTVR